jgi:hypothetical protein
MDRRLCVAAQIPLYDWIPENYVRRAAYIVGPA